MSTHLREAWGALTTVKLTYRVIEVNQGYSDHAVDVFAADGGIDVGHVNAFYRWGYSNFRTNQHSQKETWVVWSLFVDEHYRKQGIAEGMFLALHEKYPKYLVIHGGFSTPKGKAFGHKMVSKYPSWNKLSQESS